MKVGVSQMPVVGAEPPVMAGEVAGSVSERELLSAVFEGRAKLADAMEAWREDLAAKDPDAPPKEEPWYTKMLNSQAGSPEKAVKKLMGAQIDNEGKLFKKLQRARRAGGKQVGGGRHGRCGAEQQHVTADPVRGEGDLYAGADFRGVQVGNGGGQLVHRSFLLDAGRR